MSGGLGGHMIIHDIKEEEQRKYIKSHWKQETILEGENLKYCRGCFGCWVKTPGQCVMKDGFGDIGKKIAHSDHLVIVSKCYYGGFSPEVKGIVDRSIAYVLPTFRTKNKKMYHKPRYKERITLSVLFYGEISEQEKKIAKEVVKANGQNFNTIDWKVEFCKEEDVIRNLQNIMKSRRKEDEK